MGLSFTLSTLLGLLDAFRSAAKYSVSADGVFSMGLCFAVPALGVLRAGPPVAFPIGSAAKGSGTLEAQEHAVHGCAWALSTAHSRRQALQFPPACAALQGARHQLRGPALAKCHRHRPLKLARSPHPTLPVIGSILHTRWLSQQQAPPTPHSASLFWVAMFVPLNLLPHMTRSIRDGVHEVGHG